jgi:hypothetical protein
MYYWGAKETQMTYRPRFPEVIRDMLIAEGFARISDVEITDRDVPFYIPAAYATSFRMVYHLRSAALIVMVGHTFGKHAEDSCFKGEQFGYWHLAFWYETLPERKLLELAFNREKYERCLFDDNHYDIPVVGYNKPLTVPQGFRQAGYGGQYHLELEQIDQTVTEPITDRRGQDTGVTVTYTNPRIYELILAAVRGVVEEISPILVRRFQSLEIDAEDFAPSYVFKGSDDLFLKRFDFRYFRQIVPRQRGLWRYRDGGPGRVRMERIVIETSHPSIKVCE